MDNWSNVTREMMDARPFSIVLINFYVTFTGFVMLNLLVAVVCESLSAMKTASNDNVQMQEVDAADDATHFAHGFHDPIVVSKGGAKLQAIKTVSEEVKKTQSEIREILQAIMERLPQS